MTQKDKELLLKDLYARLLYGIKFKADNEECIREIYYIKDENVYIREYQNLPYWIESIKPYLRPMSNMIEEERSNLRAYCKTQEGIIYDVGVSGAVNSPAIIDFLNTHHFDYRRLIEKGLALEAPEGMYKF